LSQWRAGHGTDNGAGTEWDGQGENIMSPLRLWCA